VAGTEVIVEVIRSGLVESRHRGSVVALAADGSIDWYIGAVDVPVFPRSCNKPLQAVGMLRLGLDVHDELLALAAASHSGEPFHLDGVRRILNQAGLDERALQTPPDFPLDEEARTAFIAGGAGKSSLAMNCSGKHAAMLATCVMNGWPVSSYLDADSPLQRSLLETFSELTGEAAETVGVDGCGAPLFACSLTGLARAFQVLTLAPVGSPEQRVAEAFARFPEYTSGSRRDEAALMRALPGAVAKAGAEACYAVALPEGRALALKIEDGGGRARPVVMAAALKHMEVSARNADPQVLLRDADALVYGGGKPVGELRAVIEPHFPSAA
jgi:L-asparaginase II